MHMFVASICNNIKNSCELYCLIYYQGTVLFLLDFVRLEITHMHEAEACDSPETSCAYLTIKIEALTN